MHDNQTIALGAGLDEPGCAGSRWDRSPGCDDDNRGRSTRLAGANPDPHRRCYDAEPSTERPSRILFGCDGTGVLQNMTWSAWGPAGADGVGTADESNCVPDCASGARQTNPVVVHVANPISPGPPCPSGIKFYRDLIIAYPNGMPSGFESDDPNVTNYNRMPAYHYDATPTCASQ